ncbi:hypothetical protein BC777_1426 [Yoonia maricola]|uniref:Sulfotransferase family protein n=1 Tax=Yoonia maricola TaxID=420999 RepID=A0A2M8WNU3_9RHOB|nr:hypothetical protein [Yoonia maricola]PJI92573.1 hypothetical protein BC777_1426 [Yoonia maricola]
MKELILHIGQPKAGSSSLQRTFHRSREALLEHGVLYPQTVWGVSHRVVKAHFCGIEGAQRRDVERHNNDEVAIIAEADHAWQVILDDIAKNNPEIVVLSAEQFYSIGLLAGFRQFHDEIVQMAEKVTAVVYIRAPEARHLSLCNQALRGRIVRSAPTERVAVRDKLEPYLASDKINLCVHEFNRATLIEGDVVRDFVSRYIPTEAAKAIKWLPDDQNVSISAEAMVLLEEACTGKIPFVNPEDDLMVNEFRRRVVAADANIPGKTRPAYKPGIARVIQDVFTDLDWVRDTFGIDFPKPPMLQDPPDIRAEDLKSVRDLCPIDEARYQGILEDAKQGMDKKQPSSSTETRTLAEFLSALRFGFRFVTRPIRQSRIARKVRKTVKG